MPRKARSTDSEDEEELFDEEEVKSEDQEVAAAPIKRLINRSPKADNVAALVRGDLVVKRQSLLPKVLSVSEGAAVVRRPFKSPCPGGQPGSTEELLRRLSARRKFVPWGGRQALAPLCSNVHLGPVHEDAGVPESLPDGFEPLVLWQSEDAERAIVVDPVIAKFLRPHQREGVQFMFECVAGLRDFSKADGNDGSLSGCILADDMGLGKTLQSITLIWTLLKQGFEGSPIAKRVIIVTPTSLVSNWESEITKWLGSSRVNVLAICEASRAEVLSDISNFLSPRGFYQVLIISYETFRLHAEKFHKPGSCDLLVCDEAHRLKNDQTLTNQALAGLECRRRVLLSGTPMQNDLEEFFAMVNFTNPGILGEVSAFRRYFQNPILYGREPDADDATRDLGLERSAELSEKVNQFILRRTNALLSNHLPPKMVEVVCCRLTELQAKLYSHFIQSNNVRQALQDKTKRARVLASITALKKLCSHPKLIYDTVRAGGSEAAGFENCMQFFPPELFSGRNGSWISHSGNWIDLSGKLAVLARLLHNLRQKTDDRIVLVSNYTQTLDLFAQICRERNYPCLRLDGSTSIGKRQKLVQRFNDLAQNEFVFLLSSKAGGCGLNLIGGNRLVLFDPDWNPANDKQAAARVWRDGQKKRVYIYRFLATGTIEEKVYQRQISKEGLQKVISGDNKAETNSLSMEDLRDLFTLRDDTRSDTHDTLDCDRCDNEYAEEEHAALQRDIGGFAESAGCFDKQKTWEKQIEEPAEEDLSCWGHHAHASTVPDAMLHCSAGDEVSFVFTCQIDGKVVPQESKPPAFQDQAPAALLSTVSRQPRSRPVRQAAARTDIKLPSAADVSSADDVEIVETSSKKQKLATFSRSKRKQKEAPAAAPANKRPVYNLDDDFE